MPGDDSISDRAAPPPRANPLLLGQEAAEAVILSAIAAGRMSHAWLLTGRAGIGKATLAFRLARFLLRAGHPEAAPSSLFVGESDPIFRRVASGGHADLLTVERRTDERTQRQRSEILVDDVREVTHFLSATPAEGGWRVVVIDGADAMNVHSANALLKILEEPPPRTALLLTAAQPARLPATVRSRCRRLALAPLAETTVAELLRRYLPALTAGDVGALAGAAGGSIGGALSLAAHDGLALRRRLIAVLDRLPDLDTAEALRLGDAAAQADDGVRFHLLTEALSDWLAARIRAAAGSVAMTAAVGPLERWLEVWDNSRRLLNQVDLSNLDRRQSLLTLLFGLRAAASP